MHAKENWFFFCLTVYTTLSRSRVAECCRLKGTQRYQKHAVLRAPCLAHRAPLLLSAGPCCLSISPARGTLSSKPAGGRCCCRSTGQTDGQTDARPFHKPCSGCYAGSVKNCSVRYAQMMVGRRLYRQNRSHVRRVSL